MNIRFIGWLIAALSVPFAIWIGQYLATNEFQGVIVIFVVVALAGWTLAGEKAWWILVPCAAGFGGLFYYGFKIYFNEISIVIALLPLIPVVLYRRHLIPSHRPKLPLWVFGLFLYVCLHCAYAIWKGGGGTGNIFRSYFQAIAPLLFLFLFYRFGSTKVLRLMLASFYFACLLRWGIEVANFFNPSFSYIPGLNYVPSQGPHLLRYTGLILFVVSVGYLAITRNFPLKIMHFGVALITPASCFLSGGRVSLFSMMVLLGLMGLVFRKWLLSVMAALISIIAVSAINFNPDIIDRFPPQIQRALSVLIIQPDATAVQMTLEGSNRWHQSLRETALRKTLESPSAFFFGHRVEPFMEIVFERAMTQDASFDYMVDIAARSGAYEAGWTSILGVYGVTGLCLFSCLLYFFTKPLVQVLMRDRIRTHHHLIYYLGVMYCFYWLSISWIAGGIPSFAMLFLFIAYAVYQDEQLERRPTS